MLVLSSMKPLPATLIATNLAPPAVEGSAYWR